MGNMFDTNRTNFIDDSFVAIDNPTNLDALSRLRVSGATTKFEYTFLYDSNTFAFNSQLTAGGLASYNSTTKTMTLTCVTTANSESIYQSREYFACPIGKSMMVVLNANFNSIVANVTKRYGQYDANNGFYYELDGTNANVVMRSNTSGSPTNTAVAQSSWNLDKLNGTGPSLITLDFSKAQTMCISYHAGIGRVLFGFIINGSIVWAHQFLNSNVNTILYSQTCSLPIRASIKNNASASSTMQMLSGAVICEGGDVYASRQYSINTGSSNTNFTTAGQRKPIFSIRKQSGVTELTAQLIDYGFLLSSGDDFLLEVVKNPTLTGASWSNAPAGYMQLDLTASALSGGTTIYSSYGSGGAAGGLLSAGSSGSSSSDALSYKINSLLDGTSEIISLVGTNLTATATASAFINYRELI